MKFFLLAFAMPWFALACQSASSLPADPVAASMEGKSQERSVARSSQKAALSSDRQGGFVGVVLAGNSVDVVPAFGGKISKVHVRVGDRVEANQRLVSLDDTHARQALAVAQASLRAAQAARFQAGAGAREARKRAARRQQYADVLSLEEVESTQFSSVKAQASRSQASAEVTRQLALIAQLETKVAEAEVRAPFAGVVSLRYVDPGATAKQGQPVVHVINTQELRLRFAVPGDCKATFVAGDRIRVELEGVEGEAVFATLGQVAPALEPSTKMYMHQAMIEVPARLAEQVRAGQVGRVRLLDSQDSSAATTMALRRL